MSVPGDTAAAERAQARLGGLVGIPASEVLADVTSRIRAASWLDAWSMRHYGTPIAGTFAVRNSTPFILLSGDPGTGKSVLVHQLPALVSQDTKAPLLFVQLNGRLRGSGIQGRASTELVNVFDSISKVAGKHNVPALVFLDEAEAVAGTRAAADMSSGTLENNAIVDALIVALTVWLGSRHPSCPVLPARHTLFIRSARPGCSRVMPRLVSAAVSPSWSPSSRQMVRPWRLRFFGWTEWSGSHAERACRVGKWASDSVRRSKYPVLGAVPQARAGNDCVVIRMPATRSAFGKDKIDDR